MSSVLRLRDYPSRHGRATLPYETQTQDEALVEDEAAFEDTSHRVRALLPESPDAEPATADRQQRGLRFSPLGG